MRTGTRDCGKPEGEDMPSGIRKLTRFHPEIGEESIDVEGHSLN
jgi:hypothetical protein